MSLLFSKPTIQEISAENLPPLFDYQNSVSDEIVDTFQQKNSRAMVQMPTGSGKTRTSIHAIINTINANSFGNDNYVIWMAHTEELCEQAIETFEKSWQSYGQGVFRYYRLYGNRNIGPEDVTGGFIFGWFLAALLYTDNREITLKILCFIN